MRPCVDRAAARAADLHRISRHRLKRARAVLQKSVIIFFLDRAFGFDQLRVSAVRTIQAARLRIENHIRAAVFAQKAADVFATYFGSVLHRLSAR